MTAELIESEVMDGEQLQRILDAHKTVPQIMPGTFVEKPLRDETLTERSDVLPVAEGSA